jgi:hypothetical protein
MKSNQKPDSRLHVRKKVAGGATGAVLGAVVAGPMGALVGGVIGAVVGRAAERGGLPKGLPGNGGAAKRTVNRAKTGVQKPARKTGAKAKAVPASLKGKASLARKNAQNKTSAR